MKIEKPSASTAIFIDKYHPKSDGACAISIRVTFDRKKKCYLTPYSMTIPDFDKVMGEKPRKEYKEVALKLQSFEKKAADIVKNLPVFSWSLFEKRYLSNRGANDLINLAYDEKIQALKNNGQIGTAISYECAQNSFGKFDNRVKFTDINSDFLFRYEKWMLQQERSATTVSIYLRTLRTLFNDAITDGLLSREYYPFGKKKYEIPTSNNIKKALTLKDIASIYYYKPKKGSTEGKARDYWLFMYFCNGINIKDMCLLKYENINGDILEFERAKTVRTKRNIEQIRVVLNADTKAIIKKWGNPSRKPGDYIFPVLIDGLSPERERQLIYQITQVVNDHTKNIGKELKIEGSLTTYVARHSFATILKRSGASTEFIGEALGHSNVRTTQNYLAGFEDESKRETVKALTAFKKSFRPKKAMKTAQISE